MKCDTDLKLALYSISSPRLDRSMKSYARETVTAVDAFLVNPEYKRIGSEGVTGESTIPVASLC